MDKFTNEAIYQLLRLSSRRELVDRKWEDGFTQRRRDKRKARKERFNVPILNELMN